MDIDGKIYTELKPRFYRKVRVVYQDDNKTCAYAIHNGRWSVFDTKNFVKNFILEHNHG